MKKILIVLFAVMLLSSCNTVPDVEEVTSASAVSETTAATAVTTETNIQTTVTTTEKTAETEPRKPEKPQFEHEWQSLYYDEVVGLFDEYLNRLSINICDLDGDGIPELTVCVGDWHSAGSELYTIHEGNVIYVDNFGSWGNFQYDFERNYIYDRFSNQGATTETLYKFENGGTYEVICFDQYGQDDGIEYKDYFKINWEDVSEEKYVAEREKYSCDNYASCGFSSRGYAIYNSENPYAEVTEILLKAAKIPPYTYDELKNLTDDFLLNNKSFDNKTEYDVDVGRGAEAILTIYENNGKPVKYNLYIFESYWQEKWDFLVLNDNITLVLTENKNNYYEDKWSYHTSKYWVVGGEWYAAADLTKRIIPAEMFYAYNLDKIEELYKETVKNGDI